MKKSRKKMLLSSIAMLLVAMIALGSATFAWFTLNKTVYANDMKVEVAAAKGLVITGKNGQAGSATNWDTKYDFTNQNAKLNPASIDTSNGVSANTVYTTQITHDGKWADAAGTDSATFASETTVVADQTAGTMAYTATDYAAAYRIGVKTKDETTAMTNVALKITPTVTGSIADYVRVAVVKQDAFTTDYTADDVVKTYGNENPATAYPSVTGTAPSTAVTQTLTAFPTAQATVDTIPSLTTPVYYTILVWFEGEDGDCISNNATGTVELDVQFVAA